MENLTEKTKIKNIRNRERWKKIIIHVRSKNTDLLLYKNEILISFTLYGDPVILYIDPETNKISTREFKIKNNEYYTILDITIGELDIAYWNNKKMEYELYGKNLRQKFENFKESYLEIFNYEPKHYEQHTDDTEATEG